MGPEDQLEQLRESFNDFNVMFWAMADTAFKKAVAMSAALLLTLVKNLSVDDQIHCSLPEYPSVTTS